MINVREKGKDRCIFEIQVANNMMLTARKGMKGHASFVAFRGFDELLQYKGMANLAIKGGSAEDIEKTTEDSIAHIEQQIEDLRLKLGELQQQEAVERAAVEAAKDPSASAASDKK